MKTSPKERIWEEKPHFCFQGTGPLSRVPKPSPERSLRGAAAWGRSRLCCGPSSQHLVSTKPITQPCSAQSCGAQRNVPVSQFRTLRFRGILTPPVSGKPGSSASHPGKAATLGSEGSPHGPAHGVRLRAGTNKNDQVHPRTASMRPRPPSLDLRLAHHF